MTASFAPRSCRHVHKMLTTALGDLSNLPTDVIQVHGKDERAAS